MLFSPWNGLHLARLVNERETEDVGRSLCAVGELLHVTSRAVYEGRLTVTSMTFLHILNIASQLVARTPCFFFYRSLSLLGFCTQSLTNHQDRPTEMSSTDVTLITVYFQPADRNFEVVSYLSPLHVPRFTSPRA